jgi:TatA/E family protein of Tat protein translocase
VFGISSTELLIIALFAFIVFGPDKIPEIARTVSKAIAMFKRTQEDMERTIKAEMYNVDPSLSDMLLGTDSSKGAAGKNDAGMQGAIDQEEEDEE